MFILFSFILLFLVIEGYFVLEEETLIIIASAFWLDAAGGAIRNLLEEELVNKGNAIHGKFLYFLNAKKALLERLVALHKSRVEISTIINEICNYSINIGIVGACTAYLSSIQKTHNASIDSLFLEKANGLTQIYLYNRAGDAFGLLAKSGSSIRSFGHSPVAHGNETFGELSISRLKLFL
jgi:hypothetical protein